MKTHLNLIPVSLRRRQLIVRQVRRWGIVCCCAVIVASMLLSTRLSSRQKLHREVAKLERESSAIRGIAQSSASARTRIRIQEEQLRWLRSHEQADVPLITLAAVHQSMRGLDQRVRLNRLQFRGLGVGPGTSRGGGRKATPAPVQLGLPAPVDVNDEIQLSGSAENDTTVSVLIRQLEATGLFAEVELISLQIGSDSGTQFQIQCRIRAEVDQLQELAGRITDTVTHSTARRTTDLDQF